MGKWIKVKRKLVVTYIIIQPPDVFREFVEGLVRWVAFQLWLAESRQR